MSLDPDFFHYGPNLPHLDKPDLMHFVTFRLHDSLPTVVLLQIARELEEVPLEERQKEEYKKMEYWLNQGRGSCLLKQIDCAELLKNVLFYNNGVHYILIAGVIMGNHVHLLVKIREYRALEKIIQEWKKFSALAINKHLNRSGALWMSDYWDRAIRNKDHYFYVLRYIKKNIEQGGVRWFFKDRVEECYRMIDQRFGVD